MPRVAACIAFVSVLICAAHAREYSAEVQVGPIKDEPQRSAKAQINVDEALFRRLFSKRRKEHLEVINNLGKMQNYERLYKMLIVLGEKVFEVIESSKNLIENEGFIPRNSSFPTDANIRDALSSILENTAFFGDIVLHLPDITHRILKAQKKWNATIHWSLNFANETKHFLDRDTKNMMHLVRQELNIVKRDPQYFNPYWTATMDLGKRGESSKRSKKSSKKSRQKKGPQMIKIDL